MIHGIGVDLVKVSRLQASLERFGPAFAERILAAEEYAEFHTLRNQGHFLAKRFAAKEALVKALGTGFRDGLSFHHVRVAHDVLGCPRIQCSGRAEELLAKFNIIQSHLSISDEREFAIAMVVLETAGNVPP